MTFSIDQTVAIESLEQRRMMSAAPANNYTQTNLVSDGAVTGTVTDANLVNPWGLAAGPKGPFWLGDNGTGLSTAYIDTQTGVQTVPPTVTIPKGSAADGAAPTGVAFNNTDGFKIGSGRSARKALYLFVGEDGTVTAWNPSVDATNALVEVDNSAAGAVYKGVAIATFKGKPMVYAANFNAGTIDVFDSKFHAATLPGSFTDPTLPAGYAPFNVALIQGKLFVTMAQQDGQKHDEIDGAGLGFVDEFGTNGKFIKRFASAGTLNAPWALVAAPSNFGKFSHDILVGNFGDGTINAFNPHTGALIGQLEDSNSAVISINGLWGLSFGNGTDGKKNSLFFAAGFNDEADGLFGKLEAVTGKASGGGGGGLGY